MNLSMEQLIQFVILLAGGVGVFFNLKSRAEKNTIMIGNLENNFSKEIDLNKEKFHSLKKDHEIAYNKLDIQITKIDSEIKNISNDTSEIKGFMKALLKQKSNV